MGQRVPPCSEGGQGAEAKAWVSIQVQPFKYIWFTNPGTPYKNHATVISILSPTFIQTSSPLSPCSPSSSFGLHISHLFISHLAFRNNSLAWQAVLPLTLVSLSGHHSSMSSSFSHLHQQDEGLYFDNPTQDLTKVFLFFNFTLKNRKPNERMEELMMRLATVVRFI